MNISSSTRTVTIPWGPGTRVPPQNLAEEAEVRTEIDSLEAVAKSHMASESNDYIGNGFSKDLDPSPDRILRTRRVGEETFVLELQTTGTDKTRKPVDFVYKAAKDDSLSQRAHWENGQLVYLTQSQIGKNGTQGFTIEVNGNGTLTYTTVTPEKASETPGPV